MTRYAFKESYLTRFLSQIARSVPAEWAHHLALSALDKEWTTHYLKRNRPLNPQTRPTKIHVKGIGTLFHPIGLAAGFSKNAESCNSLEQLGFSFLELGTVTLAPQLGNPKPRMFRWKDSFALTNHLGFPSKGIDAFMTKLKENAVQIPLGINIGKNKASEGPQALEEYQKLYRRVVGQAAYVVVNLSSPNTPGLRSFQTKAFVQQMIESIYPNQENLWFKFSPELGGRELEGILETIADKGCGGIILNNTLANPFGKGGVSGAPLSSLSMLQLVKAKKVVGDAVPIISCGGILTGIEAFYRLKYGADLLQVYSALVYRGPWAVLKILDELSTCLEFYGYSNLEELKNSYEAPL